jgi:hypothetical protein
MVNAAHLTPVGRELIPLLPLSTDDKTREIAFGFRTCDFVERVAVGTVVAEIGGQLQVRDLRNIE